MKRMENMYVGFVVVAVLVALMGTAQAALIAYEDFDYAAGKNFNVDPADGGTGWVGPWASTGVSGLTASGTVSSLYFGQSPDLIEDGSNHIWSESSKGNIRSFSQGVNVSSETLYFTVLLRTYGGGNSTAQMRAELRAGAAIRGTVGVDQGYLFAKADHPSGYGVGDVASELFADDTTYLLAMKRTGESIFAALIEADGNISTLAAEPTWQVQHDSATGVTFDTIRFLTNNVGGDGGIRLDELRIATDWDSAVDGMIVPEPTALLFLGVGSLLTLRQKKRFH